MQVQWLTSEHMYQNHTTNQEKLLTGLNTLAFGLSLDFDGAEEALDDDDVVDDDDDDVVVVVVDSGCEVGFDVDVEVDGVVEVD
jgi:hypothetical protein